MMIWYALSIHSISHYKDDIHDGMWLNNIPDFFLQKKIFGGGIAACVATSEIQFVIVSIAQMRYYSYNKTLGIDFSLLN